LLGDVVGAAAGGVAPLQGAEVQAAADPADELAVDDGLRWQVLVDGHADVGEASVHRLEPPRVQLDGTFVVDNGDRAAS